MRLGPFLRLPAPVLLVLALVPACSDDAEDAPGKAGASGTSGSAGTLGSGGSGGSGGGKAGSSGAAGGAGVAGSSRAGTGNGGSSAAGAGNGGVQDVAGNAGAAGSPAAGAGAGGSSAGSGGDPSGGAGSGASGGSGGEAGGGAPEPPAILVFSQTTGFRHDSIPVGIQALRDMADERGWTISATEDPTIFADAALEPFNLALFLSPTGNNLDEAQRAAFERFIRAGNGFVGIHAASDTEFEWAFYGELVGAYFNVHPSIQPATIIVEDRTHPSTQGLMETWQRTDEWYGFRTNPRDTVHVLLSLDESSYDPDTSEMDGDHPIAWYHEYEGGRAFYTALGHTNESYSEPAFLEHVAGGILWASGNAQ